MGAQPSSAARPPVDGPQRVLLVGSSGGHLAQLMTLQPWWEQRDRLWVTFDTSDAVSRLADEEVVWAHHPTTRNIPNLLRNLRLAQQVVRRYRPDMIVSTGAGVALPFFTLGRALGIPTVYVEVYDRVDSQTLTGRLCHPLSTLFLVQSEEQRPLYRDSVVVGRLI